MTRPLLLLALLWPTVAMAGLTQRQLNSISLAPPPGARAPLDLPATTADGAPTTLGAAMGDRATILLPLDYTCPELCGPGLSIVASALRKTGLVGGRDYSLVAFGINARDGVAEARQFTRGQIDGPGAVALVADEAGVERLTRAIGYHFTRDEALHRLAHPAGFVALAADGRVTRALSTLAVDPTDLRLALVEAGEGKVGGVIARLGLLCYGFDAARGIYTRDIRAMLRLGGALTIVVLLALVGGLALRARARDARA